MGYTETVTDELGGRAIREIFKHAEALADLNSFLTSPRGDGFRFRLLQAMEVTLGEREVEELRVMSGINEYQRHLNMLIESGLVRSQQVDGEHRYSRTGLGERAINAVCGFERRAAKEAAEAIFAASLGPNSIRFFLRIYGDKMEADGDHFQIKYAPVELGRLSLFLPRVIDGISAVDKLNEADLVVYGDDNHIHVHPMKARAFYRYLRDLYGILRAHGAIAARS